MIGFAVDPPAVPAGSSRVVTVRLTNLDDRALTNIVVGLDVPSDLGLEQGRTAFELSRLSPGAAYEHALRIRPTKPGRHAISLRELSCRDGGGRSHRESRRVLEINVEEAAAVVPLLLPALLGSSAPPAPVRRSVFISYRRQDTKLMVPGLVRELGKRKALRHVDLFFDLTGIPAGAEWPRVLDAELDACDVLVAVIGPNWLSPRLYEPGDMVRREIAAVLKRDVPVVPVLADARMPTATDLPPDLGLLAHKQGFTFDLTKYGPSVASLAARLAELIEVPAARV